MQGSNNTDLQPSCYTPRAWSLYLPFSLFGLETSMFSHYSLSALNQELLALISYQFPGSIPINKLHYPPPPKPMSAHASPA